MVVINPALQAALLIFPSIFSECADTEQILECQEKVWREQELNPGPLGPEPVTY